MCLVVNIPGIIKREFNLVEIKMREMDVTKR